MVRSINTREDQRMITKGGTSCVVAGKGTYLTQRFTPISKPSIKESHQLVLILPSSRQEGAEEGQERYSQ